MAESTSFAAPPVGAMGFYVVAEYRDDLDGDYLPAEMELYLGSNHFKKDSDGDGIEDDKEDPDNDGMSNLYELIAGTDPLTADNLSVTPLQNGLVLSGDYTITFTPPPSGGGGSSPHEGVILDANGNTADSIVFTEAVPG